MNFMYSCVGLRLGTVYGLKIGHLTLFSIYTDTHIRLLYKISLDPCCLGPIPLNRAILYDLMLVYPYSCVHATCMYAHVPHLPPFLVLAF